MRTSEHAYSPLVALLERRLRAAGVTVPPAGEASLAGERKRSMLRLGVATLGAEFATQLGRDAAAQTGHPFVRALVLAPNAGELMRRWCRLEIFAHSRNRVRVRVLGVTSLRLGYRYEHAGPGRPFATRDGNLVTSQNPFSGEAFARLFLLALAAARSAAPSE